jgi:sugar (pentulose or hexulose) kinase
MVPVRKVFSPNPENTEKYNELYHKYEKLYDAVKELSL